MAGIICNRGCGSSDLHWKMVDKRYMLFGHNDLLHICTDGETATKKAQEKATAKIMAQLGITEPASIPLPEEKKPVQDVLFNDEDRNYFTINSTASGVAITGDDKHNAIYLPKVAITDLVKALVDFI